jgi:hypothetical protein
VLSLTFFALERCTFGRGSKGVGVGVGVSVSGWAV